MQTKPTDTKSKALEIAKAQLQLNGFNGFSFQDIADDLGIRKASLHYYFSSKEDLGLALISDYKDAFLQWTLSVENLNPLEKLEKFGQIFYKMSQDKLKICPTGAYCTDFNSLSTKMKKSLSQFHEAQRTWLEEVIAQGKKEAFLSKDLSAKDTACLILSTVQGSLQLARMNENSRLVKQSFLVLLELIKN